MDEILRILFFLFMYVSTLYIGYMIGRIVQVRRMIKFLEEEMKWMKELDSKLASFIKKANDKEKESLETSTK